MTQSLRVLHIASGDLWAGAEVQAFTLISHLARMPDVEAAAVLMNNGTLADALRAAGISVSVIDERRTAAAEILIRMRREMRRWRPDVVHTHRQKENIIGSLANRTCCNVPCVRTVHGAREHSGGAGLRGLRYRAVDALDRWCGSALQQRVIAVTQDLATRLKGEFPAGKVTVIENGVDSEAVRAVRGIAEFRLSQPDAVHIGIAGRLAEVKRVDLFIEAAALLLRRCPQHDWRFHVFGEGPERPKLQELSQRLQTADRVRFHGHRQDIETCVGGLDALVICSDHEGMPMVALEAITLGVPTVAHAVGGLIDVVPREFLVVRHDPQGYGDGILKALGEDGPAIVERHAMEVLTKLSAQRNAERIRALYEQVLAERRAKMKRKAGKRAE